MLSPETAVTDKGASISDSAFFLAVTTISSSIGWDIAAGDWIIITGIATTAIAGVSNLNLPAIGKTPQNRPMLFVGPAYRSAVPGSRIMLFLERIP